MFYKSLLYPWTGCAWGLESPKLAGHLNVEQMKSLYFPLFRTRVGINEHKIGDYVLWVPN